MTTWYRTGTVSVTNGSAAVTGSGTQWIDGAKKGDAMHLADGRVYEILTINSNTSVTLASDYLGSTGSGQSYAIQPTRGVVKSVFDSLTQLLSNFSSYQSGPLLGRFGVGTPTEPSISNLNDQDTGLYFPAANQMAASAGGVLRWLLTTTGFTLNVPMTGTAVVQSTTDITTGRLLLTGTGAVQAYRQGNILGAVSQSGGVPTGAIVERGNNANGDYVRFADGTQICWQSAALSQSVAATSYAEVTWTYPAAFVGGSTPNPRAAARSFNDATSRQNAARYLRPVGGGVGSTSGILGVFNSHTSALDARVDGLAMGRWF